MYLFFDTETTGLPRNWKAPVTDVHNWPRMVQIAWLVYDRWGTLVEAKDFIIKPEGYTIPADVAKVHGITTERAIAEGDDLLDVLTQFNTQVNKAKFMVAHNMSFDEKIIGAEFIRKNIKSMFLDKDKICTMNASTNYCKIPGPYGFKWPKLSELHIKLFGNDFQEAHNAAADIQATAKCFWKLKELDVIKVKLENPTLFD
jgi:DNA polymerase-3 subunit epsilon